MQKLTDRGILSEEKTVALKGIDTVYHKQQGSMGHGGKRKLHRYEAVVLGHAVKDGERC